MDELILSSPILRMQRTAFMDEDEIEEEEYSEDEALVGLFKGKRMPDYRIAWEMYSKGLAFNVQINLDETVNVNENFFVGRVA